MWLLHFGLLEMSVSPPAILVSGTPTVTPYIEYYCNLTISLLKKKEVSNAERYRKKRDDDYQKT